MPSLMMHRHPGYAEWLWPQLLFRCMELPPGVFELIADMLPMPRVWQWSLMRLRQRCRLASQQAVIDMSILMDEILADANMFKGHNQQQLLVKLNRNPEVCTTTGFSRFKLRRPPAYFNTRNLLFNFNNYLLIIRSSLYCLVCLSMLWLDNIASR
jgi:hypothetical protein